MDHSALSTRPYPHEDAEPLLIRELGDREDLNRLRTDVDLLALKARENSRYIGGFAVSRRCKEMAFRLRYEVFNLELGEGLASSTECGLDRDPFDDQMTHLVVLERVSQRIVGTYRLQTASHGLARLGLYSGQEFDLAPLKPYLDEAVECGRACVAREHRSISTLFVLWKGIAEFVKMHRQRWLFGCCSLTTVNPDDGWRAKKTLRRRGCLHESLTLRAREGYSCGRAEREFDPDLGDPVPLPKLFDMYMRLGAKVISEPAIDREFGTVDFLVLMDSTKGNLEALEKPSVSGRLREEKTS